MGLFSSLLSIGGAALGSVVPGVGTALGASLGGALGGALESSKGSSKATAAQLQALQEARGIEGKAYQDVRDVQSPYLNFGGGATNALSSRLRITPTTTPASNNALSGTASPTAISAGTTTMPASTGSGADSLAPPGSTSPPVTADAGTSAQVTQQPGVGVSANALSGAVAGQTPAAPTSPSTTDPNAGGAPGVDPGTYGATDNPTAPTPYVRPPDFTYSLSDYKASPGYAWQQDQAQKAILSSAGATGALQSGAALKELQDRAQQIAYQDFTGERAFAAGRADNNRQFDYGQSRDARGDYQNNRDYLSNRFDTQTNNLFKASNQGQNAAGTISNAATQYGNQVAGLVTDGGKAQATNALTQGQIGSDLATGLGGIIAGAFPPKAGASANALATLKDPYLY